MGVGNLVHFMHKITLFINSRGLKPEQGAEPPFLLTLTTGVSCSRSALCTILTSLITGVV